MTGQEAVERIHQEAWIGREPGLSRITKLLSMVGDPHKELKFVHITGTNGKGSTASMTASILAAAGLRVGLYTSPHLWRFHERFQVCGRPIPDEALGRIGERVILAGRQMDDPATEFELMTALGMLYFREAQCDLVVLEVGLGGRLDSTNVIPAPEVAVITNIGLEHVEQLGDTHAKIAGEKAGIIKPGCDTVLYHQRRDVEEVVTDACRHAGSPMTVTDPDSLEVLSTGRDGQNFMYRGEGPYHINLLGHYQLSNALTALDIAAVLRRRGWPISREAVMQGMREAVWPARMELARRDPDVILDGGHNPQCMGAIRQALEELYPGKKILFLVGVLEDKDYHAMVGQLLPLARAFITITPDNPRAMQAADLAAYLRGFGKPATACDVVEDGVKLAIEHAGENGVVLCYGSLYMIGDVDAALKKLS